MGDLAFIAPTLDPRTKAMEIADLVLCLRPSACSWSDVHLGGEIDAMNPQSKARPAAEQCRRTSRMG